jgi:microcystin degradation protein MlrC
VEIVHAAVKGTIKPTMAMFDCRMIEIFPTDRSPMREFVDNLCEMEAGGEILSASVIHGFMAGDVPDLGTKMLVITDNRPEAAEEKARKFGMQLFEMRGSTRPTFLNPTDTVHLLKEQCTVESTGPIVVADVWDNPGGGVPGDSTILLNEVLKQKLTGVALATIWDPMAVRLCHSAGEGAILDLRFGGKTSASGGKPIDATVTVTKTQCDAWQSFGDSRVPLGDSAVISFDGIEVILNTNRSQAFEPNIFSNMGIDPLQTKILIVKSTNHFYGGFAPIASKIHYVDVTGPYPSDPKSNNYQQLQRTVWPRTENPHGTSE